MGDLHDRYGLCNGIAAQIAIDLGLSGPGEAVNQRPPYAFLPLAFWTLAAYATTAFLARRKRISLITHRRIWNLVLTLSFLLSGLLGLLLVLRINYGFLAAWHQPMLRLHVQAGIVMAIVSFFHLAWHWPYYALLFRRPAADGKKLAAK